MVIVGSAVDTAVTSRALRTFETTMARNDSQNADPLGFAAGFEGVGVEEGVEGMLLDPEVMCTWELSEAGRAIRATEGGGGGGKVEAGDKVAVGRLLTGGEYTRRVRAHACPS